MPVYMIQSGDKVKIGWADDVEARRRQHQTSNPDRLEIVRTIDGDRSTERWLHERFAGCRLRGEWFRLDPDMHTVEPPAVAPAQPRPKREVLPRVSWWADMCSLQNPCAECRDRTARGLSTTWGTRLMDHNGDATAPRR